MSAIELAVPCVAAHLLAAGVLRFLPTDATAECETCGGRGYDRTKAGATSAAGCPHCRLGRRPFRAGDRIAIRASSPFEPCSRCRAGGLVDGMHGPRGCPECGGDCYVRARDAKGRFSFAPGEVVGYATVTNVLPIITGPITSPWPHTDLVRVANGNVNLWRFEDGPDTTWKPNGRLSDHVDAGLVFTPGQIALELAAGDDL